MDKQSSLYEELMKFVNTTNQFDATVIKGQNVIATILNFKEWLDKHYTPEESNHLFSKLMLSVKQEDDGKFINTVRRIEYGRKRLQRQAKKAANNPPRNQT